MRLLCLGDSYTIGEGAAPDARWPEQAAALLRADGVPVETELVARTSWTVGELAAALADAEADGRVRGPYDAATLLVGVNDQYRRLPIGGYAPAYRALLGRAAALAGGDAGRVMAVSFPDWGVTPFGGADEKGRSRSEISAEVDAFNAAAQAEAARAGARWVDVTALSRAQGAWVVADGLHPNAEAYAAWAVPIADALRAAVGLPGGAAGELPGDA